MKFLVVLLVLGGPGVSGDCSEGSSGPKVTLDDIVSTIVHYGNAVFNDPSSGKRKSKLTCSHSSPVRWDIPSPDDSLLDIILNLYWKGDTQYFGHIAVSPQSSRKTTPSDSHVPFGVQCDFRSVPRHTSTSLSNMTSMIVPRQPVIHNDTNCDLFLLYRVAGTGNKTRLEYKWESLQGESSVHGIVTKTRSPDYFRGLYPSVPQNPSCVKQLKATDPCGRDCRFVNGTLTAVIFHAEVPNRRPLVAKGVFDVFSSPDDHRDFRWEWDVPLEQMVKIDSPSWFFVNKTENVSCTVSGMLFAYGAIINLQSLQERNLSLFHELDFKNKSEVYVNHGMRKLTRQVLFQEERAADAILCSVPLIDFSRNFSKTFSISVTIPQAPTIRHVSPPSKVTLNVGAVTTLTCRITGKPRPTLTWTFPTPDLEFNVTESSDSLWEVESSLEITDFHERHEGAYKCSGENYLASVSNTFELQLPKGLSSSQKISFSAGLGSVITLFVLILGGMYGKIILQRQKYRRMTFEAKQEFMEGIPGQKEFPEDKEFFVHQPTFLSQPFDDSLDVPFDNWTIDDKILGTGNFGLVRRGRVKFPEDDEPVEVAVKTLRSVEDIDDFKRFLYELKLMKCIGYHPNIVCLVASCVEKIDERDVMIGVELCSNGSLEDYLRKHGPKLKQFITGESSDAKSSQYKNIHVAATPSALYKNLEEYDDLTEVDLYTWALHIANGMEFLASKLVLHGDLAVRNVLLSGDKVAKISDFGLSRHLDENANYKKKSKVGVPWKYLPIESLTTHVFSTASDVWAYGVTLWEIFSLGQAPYPGVLMGKDFLDQLLSGMRLNKPHMATDFVYEIMSDCWHENPPSRPTFAHLKHQFGGIVEQLKLQTQQTSPGRTTPTFNPRRTNRTPQTRTTYTNLPKPENFYLNG